ncbi:putative diphthamide synthesis protein-domain-containing protein [Ephemerocybe angulata]|uniref:2-(3-amino-3-carboxypropyl)histidine synthase subunit 2 n=1 Tax=Ephemerocybe angulata TaxID=980116 RepID=A0A8H6HT50_9AGAR|nr:putative diphthamide synthesis protein-domain-containing protein [Tulosesus angulatus]
MSAFSNTGQDVIQQTIHIDHAHARTQDIHEFYEIERTADEILAGDFKRIALQFPDELLGDSVPVFRALKARIGTGREIYVLADTSYGSCCVDEVAAQHVDADMVVHYGYACLSQTSRLPVMYVFGKKTFDVGHALSSLLELLEAENQSVLLKSDVMYSHLMGELLAVARDALKPRNVSVDYEPLPSKTSPASNTEPSDDSHPPPPPSTIFYIGPETLALTNLLMTNAQSQVLSYDPESKSAKVESGRTNRMLMRRYAALQKAKDADVFGILVGTLGVASYLPLIKHLRSLLAKSHKKSYTISVGKLNPAKLANFMEIECFILVACPENSLIDAKEFYQPIVTPYELEIALGAGRSWDGKYVLNFDQLLRESKQDQSDAEKSAEQSGEEEETDDIDQPQFSLISGKYRQAKRYGDSEPNPSSTLNGDTSTSLVVRNQEDALTALPNSAALQFLHQRTYQGLEVRLGEDEPGVLEQGRSGIAKGYQTDKGVAD